MAPMGIAKNSQGSITRAAIREIMSGSWVRVAASKGAAVFKIPSAKLLAIDADQRLLKVEPKPDCFSFVVFNCFLQHPILEH
jgi:hypothetical protein